MKKLLLLSIIVFCASANHLMMFKANEKAQEIKEVKKPEPLANKTNANKMTQDSEKPKYWSAAMNR